MEKQFFKWDEKYSIGLDLIDEQHKKIVELINRLYIAFAENKSQSELKIVIDEMADYADFHFQFEERYFKLYQYADAKIHIEEHRSFTEKVNEFKRKFDISKFPITFTVLNFLKDWLTSHISTTDAKYVATFKQHKFK